MSRILIPSGFKPVAAPACGPALQLQNSKQHTLSIQPISDSIVRVVHELPKAKYPQKTNDGVHWESAAAGVKASHLDHPMPLTSHVWVIAVDSEEKQSIVQTKNLLIKVATDGCPRLEWFAKDKDGKAETTSFMADSHSRAYSYDAATGAVLHYVERENHLPVSEDEFTPPPGLAPFIHDDRNEFVYGLGESRGTLEKSGKKFTMEGRDALSYSWTDGDPLYKVQPFYIVYNKKSSRWHGVFYNNLNDAYFDMGAESDVLWGCFRSYKSQCGPLDYYVLSGDGTLGSIVTEYASLMSPSNTLGDFLASPTLPPLSQFGYLSSSLALAADPKAQEAIIDFLTTSRKEGFPVDGLYLSSGWCQDEVTDDRNYFSWNRKRYPDPTAFGKTVEKDLEVQVIVNIKPWLLDVHPMVESAEKDKAFMGAAPDTVGDLEQSTSGGSAKSWVWGSGFASHKLGRYFDYSSKAGTAWWQKAIKEQLLDNSLTGMWIDNNEMAGLVDGDVTFKGEVGMWNASGQPNNVEKRMGWGGNSIKVGRVGKMINTIGMARATFEGLIAQRPNDRPVVVSRSGVPGIQAYAHGTWSGDNSTTWQALKWGTKMTLSVGLSFGPGLFGHDIGGFAGKHHPSPELLVRWCQNGAWHSRFTVHSWKEISTTMWMYKDVPEVTEILRDTLNFRYRMAPTFYSLYVTDYQRHGHPLLKPLMWYHASEPTTLKLDEEFIFGSHILVAPVTTKGAVTRDVYLSSSTTTGERDLQWCELDTGIWHAGKGDFQSFDVPLSRTLALVRGGGILVLGGECKTNIYNGTNSRTALIFPSPKTDTSSGSFTLIEDDGRSNDHTTKGAYTEIVLSFQVVGAGKKVEVDYEIVKDGWKLPYDEVVFELPKGDERELVVKEGKEAVQITKGKDGKKKIGIKVVQ